MLDILGLNLDRSGGGDGSEEETENGPTGIVPAGPASTGGEGGDDESRSGPGAQADLGIALDAGDDGGSGGAMAEPDDGVMFAGGGEAGVAEAVVQAVPEDGVEDVGCVPVTGGPATVPELPCEITPVSPQVGAAAPQVALAPVIDEVMGEATGVAPSENFVANLSSVEGFASQVVSATASMSTVAAGIVGQVDGWVANYTGQLVPADYDAAVQPTFDAAKIAIEGALPDVSGRASSAMNTGLANVDSARASLDSRLAAAVASSNTTLDGLENTLPVSFETMFTNGATDVRAQGGRAQASAVAAGVSERFRYLRLAGQYAHRVQEGESSWSKDPKLETYKEQQVRAVRKAVMAGRVGQTVASKCTNYANRIAMNLERRASLAAAAVRGEVQTARDAIEAKRVVAAAAIETAHRAARKTLETDAESLTNGVDGNRTAYLNQLAAEQEVLGVDVAAEVENRRLAIETVGEGYKESVPAAITNLQTTFDAKVEALRGEIRVLGARADQALVQSLVDTLSADFDLARAALQTELDGKSDAIQADMDTEVVSLDVNVQTLIDDANASASKAATDFAMLGEQEIAAYETGGASAGTALQAEVLGSIQADLDAIGHEPAACHTAIKAGIPNANAMISRGKEGAKVRMDVWIDGIPAAVTGASLASPSGDMAEAAWKDLIDQQLATFDQAMRINPAGIVDRLKNVNARWDQMRTLRELSPAQLQAVRHYFESTTGKDFEQHLSTMVHLTDGNFTAVMAYAEGNKIEGVLAELRERSGDLTGSEVLSCKEVLTSLTADEIHQVKAAAANDPIAARLVEHYGPMFDQAAANADAAMNEVAAVDPSVWQALNADPTDMTTLANVAPERLAEFVRAGKLPRDELLLVLKQSGLPQDHYDGVEICADPQRTEREYAQQVAVYAGFLETNLHGQQARAGWGGEGTTQNRREMRALLSEIQGIVRSGLCTKARYEQIQSRYRLLNHVHQRAFNSRMDNVDTAITAAKVTRTVAKTAGSVAVGVASAGNPAVMAAYNGVLETADSLANDMILEDKSLEDSAEKAALRGGIGMLTSLAGGVAGRAVTNSGGSEAAKHVTGQAVDYVTGTGGKVVEKVHTAAEGEFNYQAGDRKPQGLDEIVIEAAGEQVLEQGVNIVTGSVLQDRHGNATKNGLAKHLWTGGAGVVADTGSQILNTGVSNLRNTDKGFQDAFADAAEVHGRAMQKDPGAHIVDSAVKHVSGSVAGDAFSDDKVQDVLAANPDRYGGIREHRAAGGHTPKDGELVGSERSGYRVIEARDDGTSTIVRYRDGQEAGVEVIVSDPAKYKQHLAASEGTPAPSAPTPTSGPRSLELPEIDPAGLMTRPPPDLETSAPDVDDASLARQRRVGLSGQTMDEARAALLQEGYRIDKNGVIRRPHGYDDSYPQLRQVDGRVVEVAAGDKTPRQIELERLRRRNGGSRNLDAAMERQGNALPRQYDRHHVVPISTLADSDLHRELDSRADAVVDWVNDPANLVGLPEKDVEPSAYQHPVYGDVPTEKQPAHSGAHPGARSDAARNLRDTADELIREWGSLRNVPTPVLEEAMHDAIKRQAEETFDLRETYGEEEGWAVF